MNNTTATYLHAGDSLIKVVIYPATDGGYCARVPSISGIAAWAPNTEEAFVRIETELRKFIQRRKKKDTPIPWHPEGEESMIRTVKIANEDMPTSQFTFAFAKPPPNEKPSIDSRFILVGGLYILGVATLIYLLYS